MNITEARYFDAENKSIIANIDGVEMSVPVEPGNRHYQAIVDSKINIAPYVAPEPDRKSEILDRLREIDIESIRPLRAIKEGTDTQFDHDRLSNLEAEAKTLRDELASLQ